MGESLRRSCHRLSGMTRGSMVLRRSERARRGRALRWPEGVCRDGQRCDGPRAARIHGRLAIDTDHDSETGCDLGLEDASGRIQISGVESVLVAIADAGTALLEMTWFEVYNCADGVFVPFGTGRSGEAPGTGGGCSRVRGAYEPTRAGPIVPALRWSRVGRRGMSRHVFAKLRWRCPQEARRGRVRWALGRQLSKGSTA